MKPLISVIIPTYNEDKTIAEIIKRVLKTPFPKEELSLNPSPKKFLKNEMAFS